MNTALIIISIMAFLMLWYFAHVRAVEARKISLMEKYNDAETVKKILEKCFWQGQTSEQLLDSLGRPYDIGRKVMKSKTKEVWKYNRLSTNRYGLRITLEDDIVVGWDKK